MILVTSGERGNGGDVKFRFVCHVALCEGREVEWRLLSTIFHLVYIRMGLMGDYSVGKGSQLSYRKQDTVPKSALLWTRSGQVHAPEMCGHEAFLTSELDGLAQVQVYLDNHRVPTPRKTSPWRLTHGRAGHANR